MPNTYKSTWVRCPFYREDDSKRVLTCEGIIDGSLIQQKFRKKADMYKCMEIFCIDCYEKCEIYRMLMEAKYE